jgi:hypothetical protein
VNQKQRPPMKIQDRPAHGKQEMLRRLRLGDLKRLFRKRYGHTLPDDDAGREDLRELLLPISLGSEAGRKMENAVAVWAPWMATDEAQQLIDQINLTPTQHRKPTARDLGERLRLTYEQRKALGIRTIAPCDMSDEELHDRRKARRAYLQWKRRQAKGGMTRAEYSSKSLTRLQPWDAQGISRRTWYRRRGTSLKLIKLNIEASHLCQSPQEDIRASKVEGSKKVARA